jgi:hypothetical protein
MLGERFRAYFSDFVGSANCCRPKHRKRPRLGQKRESEGAHALTAVIIGSSEDIQYTFQLVGEHMQRHLGGNPAFGCSID